MNMSRWRVTLTAVMTLALICFGTSADASGTLQKKVLTFAGVDNTVTFAASPVGSGLGVTLSVDFAPDGNAVEPLAAEPFSAPAIVKFAVNYNNAPITGFSFDAQQASSTFVASGTVATSVQVQLIANKVGVGQYKVSLLFANGNAGAAANWDLVIAGLPVAGSGTRALIAITEDTGELKGLKLPGACAAACPAGQSCQGPAPSACSPPNVCQLPCPTVGPKNICLIDPWICHPFPWPKQFPWPPPSPCTSCPPPWSDPFPDGIERVLVEFVPLSRDGAPIGAAKAEQIKINIKGGETVGAVFDEGDGQYLQMLQHPKGAVSSFSVTAAGVTSKEFLAEPDAQAGAGDAADGGIFKTLTYLLSVLLAVAVVAGAMMWRRTAAR